MWNTELHRVRSLTEEGLFEPDEDKADLRNLLFLHKLFNYKATK